MVLLRYDMHGSSNSSNSKTTKLVSLKNMDMPMYNGLYFHCESGDGLKLRVLNLGAYSNMLCFLNHDYCCLQICSDFL